MEGRIVTVSGLGQDDQARNPILDLRRYLVNEGIDLYHLYAGTRAQAGV